MKSKVLLTLTLMCVCLVGCENTASVIDPAVTMPPEPIATPEPTPEPTPEAEQAPAAEVPEGKQERTE